ncbi:MAG: cytochrome c maturation protein CcmE [Chloroflexota bacterium]
MRRPARPVVVGALIILAALGFLVYQGISNNVVYFIYPHELLAKGSAADGQSFRLGGQVKPGTRQWDASTQTLRFVLQDTKDAVQVVSRGVPPEMFREGIGVVVEGTYTHGVFQARNLMIKHSSDYQAPKPGHVPKSDNFVHGKST